MGARGLLLSDQLGPYQLIDRLAIGGMGEVFLAREHGVAGFERIVVVKRLLPELARKPGLIGLFVDEARLWGQLSHPNIVQVYNFGEEAGSYFLAMEYVPGPDLERLQEKLLQTGERLSLASALHVVLELARALEFAHSARAANGQPLGIIHRDVTPHNALLSFFGDVKLTDFGIAKSSLRMSRTETGTVRGKLGYMAPEQLRGEPLTPAADLFALGVVLWELTVGTRLYGSNNYLEVIHADPPAPSTIDPEYPKALEQIVMSTLARDPAERLSTASALIAALKGFAASAGIQPDKDDLGGRVRKLFPEEREQLRELEHDVKSEALTLARERTRTAPSEQKKPTATFTLSRPAAAASIAISLAVAALVITLRPRPQTLQATPIPRVAVVESPAPLPAAPAPAVAPLPVVSQPAAAQPAPTEPAPTEPAPAAAPKKTRAKIAKTAAATPTSPPAPAAPLPPTSTPVASPPAAKAPEASPAKEPNTPAKPNPKGFALPLLNP